ncbi:MAG: hypothetical protein LBJ12_01095 [Oscillospiraceae bacterium]|nr:hypothetical protein [Oscillospiraceae bacterium]
MLKRKRSYRWQIAKKMPPLQHSIPGEVFTWEKSEVCAWLCKQPELMYILYNSVKDHGDIIYDPETGKWQGVDFDG